MPRCGLRWSSSQLHSHAVSSQFQSTVLSLAVWLDEKLAKMRLIALGTVLTDVRDVKEKRWLHRVFIATQSPNRIRTWSYELPDGMSSLLAAKVSTRSSPQKRRLFVMSQRNAEPCTGANCSVEVWEGNQSPKNESETRETESQKVQSTWPAQCGRTIEGFWKSSRTGLSHPAIQDE